MELAVHVGAHCTEVNMLNKCLEKNRELFGQYGTYIPKNNLYRKRLRKALDNTQSNSLSVNLLESLFLDPSFSKRHSRVVMSNEHFFGVPRLAAKDGIFYGKATVRLKALIALFPDAELQIFLVIRNPATFLPALFERSSADTIYSLLNGADPIEYSWFDFVSYLSREFPQLNLNIYCYEDLPFTWSEMVRDIVSIGYEQDFVGQYRLVEDILTHEGRARFHSYLSEHPHLNELQKKKVSGSFLDKYAQQEKVEQSIEIPSWSDDLIQTLTETYEEDTFKIADLPRVKFAYP